MLPIITVGLTDAARAVVERISGDRGAAHYETAEEALWDLPTDSNPTVAQATLDPDGEHWRVHVIYGDHALGHLLTHTKLDTRPDRVPNVGANLIVTDSIGGDPTAARRVVDGTPEERSITRSAVEAVSLLKARALLVVDQLGDNPNWPEAVKRVLDTAEERPAVAASGEHPGVEAGAEMRRLEALRAQGQTRPAYFEGQGRL